MGATQENEEQKRRAEDLRKQIELVKKGKTPKPTNPRDAIHEKMRELDRDKNKKKEQ